MSRSGKSMGIDPKGCMLGLRRAAYKATCTIYCRRRTIKSGFCRRRRRAPKRRPARCSSGSGELRLLTRDRPGACGAMRAAGSYPAGSRCCLAGPATAHRCSAGAESRFGILPKRCIVATFAAMHCRKVYSGFLHFLVCMVHEGQVCSGTLVGLTTPQQWVQIEEFVPGIWPPVRAARSMDASTSSRHAPLKEPRPYFYRVQVCPSFPARFVHTDRLHLSARQFF